MWNDAHNVLITCTPRCAGGRVVFVNAELHMLANDASPDFNYTGNDGQPAYQRWAVCRHYSLPCYREYSVLMRSVFDEVSQVSACTF